MILLFLWNPTFNPSGNPTWLTFKKSSRTWQIFPLSMSASYFKLPSSPTWMTLFHTLFSSNYSKMTSRVFFNYLSDYTTDLSKTFQWLFITFRIKLKSLDPNDLLPISSLPSSPWDPPPPHLPGLLAVAHTSHTHQQPPGHWACCSLCQEFKFSDIWDYFPHLLQFLPPFNLLNDTLSLLFQIATCFFPPHTSDSLNLVLFCKALTIFTIPKNSYLFIMLVIYIICLTKI